MIINRLLTSHLFWVFLLFIFAINIQSQSNSNPTLKTANEHILFINKLTDILNNTQKCIYSLYSDLERSRNPKYNNFIGSGYICSQFIDDKQFDNLIVKTKGLLPGKALELNTNAQSLYDVFLKINQLCRELEIYVRLKDYTNDRLKKSDELYRQLMALYDSYNLQKKKYYESLLNITRTLVNNPVYLKFREYLDGELDLASGFRLNFNVYTFTSNIEIKSLLEQIKFSDNLLAEIQIPQTDEMYYARNLVNVAKNQLQRTKREAIDLYSVEAKKSDGYSNNFMDSYLIYLNEYLVADFNNFVKNSADHMLLYPKCLLSFKIDSIKKEFVTKKACIRHPKFQIYL